MLVNHVNLLNIDAVSATEITSSRNARVGGTAAEPDGKIQFDVPKEGVDSHWYPY